MIFTGGPAPIQTSERLPRLLAGLLLTPSPARPVDLLLDGVAMRFTDGYTPSVPTLRSALEVFRRHAEDGGPHSTRWFWMAWLLAGELWDDCAPGRARDSGRVSSLETRERWPTFRSPSSIAAGVHINAGEFRAAAALIEESGSIAAATGYAPFGYASTLLVAWRGNESKAMDHFAWGRQRGDSRRGTGDPWDGLQGGDPVQRARPLRRGVGARPDLLRLR